MFDLIDRFFCELEGIAPRTQEQSPIGLSGTSGERLRQLLTVNGLDGWKDDKEKFKLDLINDIKTFLFGKWEKPWDGSVLFDVNGKVISGFYNIHGRGYYDRANILSLAMNAGESPFFITGAQIAKQGGTVKDAKKWVGIISFIPITDEKLKDEPAAKVKFMLPKSHSVINVDFVDGIKKPIYKTVEFEKKELNEYIEAFIAELVKRKRVPKLHYDQADKCYYSYTIDFSRDSIHMVNINQFNKIEGYYSTLFHEITHSTKNPDRVGRGKNATKLAYANEELVAEMGAMILCSELGLEYTRQNSLSYLNSWLKSVKGDPDTAMLEAYSYACDAVEYLLADIDLASLVPQSMTDRANNMANEPENATTKKPKATKSKEVDVYGVSMSEIENSHNSKFNDNNGIAMNTVSSDERTLITQEWLNAHRNGGDVNKALELYKSLRNKKKVTAEKTSVEPKKVTAEKTSVEPKKVTAEKTTVEPSKKVTAENTSLTEAQRYFIKRLGTDKFELVEPFGRLWQAKGLKIYVRTKNIRNLAHNNEEIRYLRNLPFIEDVNDAGGKQVLAVTLKKVTDEKTSTRDAIFDIQVSEIATDEKRFQNRANNYSADSANRIIKAVETSMFSWAKFDPITVWADDKGKKFVLSGHSRLAAFKFLSKTQKEFEFIPARIFRGTEAEAIDLALNSNTLSTKETDAERAGYYHRMRQQCEVGNLKGLGAVRTDCDKQVEAKCRDQEGKNANFILNLSYLAPRGFVMDSLHATGMERDNDSTNVLRTIANWIGEARRSFPQVSDVHETEIAKWLLGGAYGSKAGQFRKKQDFLERIRVALSKFKGGADDSINIAQNVGKTSFEKEWEKRLDTAKTELADAEKDHAERYDKYLNAVMSGEINNERMLELMKPLTANVQKLREVVDSIKKQHGVMREAEGRQKSLFGVDDVDGLIAALLSKSEPFRHVKLSEDNYGKEFKDGCITTPIGIVKIHKTQIYKLIHKARVDFFGLIKPTLENPLLIVKSKDAQGKEREAFIKTFTDGETIFFVSFVKTDKELIVVSNHSRREGQMKKILSEGKVIYPADSITALLGIPNISKPNYKTIIIGLRLESSAKVIRNSEKTDTNNGINNALNGAEIKDDILEICKSVYGDKNVFEISKGSDNNFGLAPLGTAKRAKTSRLRGDLGKFLGEYDRHCYTIALKGDKGAGKSRLMFQLVNAYAGAKLRCAILSLEMSPESSVIQNYATSYIEPKNKAQIAITGESQDYESLSKICSMYDVVAIDSWNKVRGAVQTDFDRLQKEHPETIIISIFQSTTGKVTRGGNMVEYDAGTVIQVHKGGHAECEKNRYASTDLVFNVFDKKLEVKND